jgi:hypothetical protein
MENKKQQPIDVPVRHGLREYSCKICKECIFFKEQTTPDLTTVQTSRDSQRRLPSSPDFSSKKKKRKYVLWSSGGELTLAYGKQTLAERLTVKHH